MTLRSAFPFLLAAAVTLVFVPAGVRAEACPASATYCVRDTAGFDWTTQSGLNFSFNTGWVPGGSPLQVRMVVGAKGRASVNLRAEAGASYPAAVFVGVGPLADVPSSLSVDYGFEFSLRFRFSVSVFGSNYSYEGDIPIGAIPSDMLMRGETSFPHMGLAESEPLPVTVRDSTGTIRLVKYDAIGQLASIPGLSGGVAVDARVQLDASYVTGALNFQNTTPTYISNKDDRARRAVNASGNYGARIDVNATPQGTLTQKFSIVLLPTIYIDILGFDWNVSLFELPITLYDGSIASQFSSDLLQFRIPDVLAAGPVAFGTVRTGQRGTASFSVENKGEGPLEFYLTELPDGVYGTEAVYTLEPGASRTVELYLDGVVPTSFDSTFKIHTNDPDSPVLTMGVTGRVYTPVELPDGGVDEDAGVDEDGGVDEDAGVTRPAELSGGCGCRVSPGTQDGTGAPAAAALLALGFVLVLRRRARR